MLKKIALGLLVTASLSYGSATIFKGTSQAITIDSEPEGAKVYVDGQLRGITPLSINMKKSLSTHTFRVVKEGYSPVTRTLEKSYDPVAILNIVWDLSTTDMLTGAAFEYSPNNYMVQLEKKK
ncbi:PEGA domain-containing protein [Sulfurimonas hydrogeniphila]|uniref:PEGA domain-containing protein n=1 Tax=Sulfurimonas hydrogeniphila TaxID=2509341 RepID=UPI00125FBDE2|nr:PEGA domain-containing protein [Sulfurimonas hydrogeniphila]